MSKDNLLLQWIAETPHQRGSINGLAAQVAFELSQEPLGAKLYPAPAKPRSDERQPLSKVLAAVREYLPPDGITAQECLNRIIAVVVPWPLPSKPLIAFKDSEISLMAHNEDEGDWNDPRYRECWHDGFLDGAKAMQAAHGIKETS